MSLEVIQAFGWVGLQGVRRYGRRRFGVPSGGAFDRESMSLANAMAGVPPETPAFELGMANVRFRALANGRVAVVGAPVPITVDGCGVPSQAVFGVHAGAEIHIGPPSAGCRAYVAFRPEAHAARTGRRLAESPSSLAKSPLRVVTGPQAERLDLAMLNKSYRVSGASDRVGVRLEGLSNPHEIELPSEPACIGAIQLTNAGDLVILGPDGPTIGGYPKPAVVIDADFDQVAQLRPGVSVSFELVNLEEARELRRARLTRLAKAIAEIRLATR